VVATDRSGTETGQAPLLTEGHRARCHRCQPPTAIASSAYANVAHQHGNLGIKKRTSLVTRGHGRRRHMDGAVGVGRRDL
jgi:hypothetical protein